MYLPSVIAWVGVVIRDKVSMKEEISASEIPAENSILFIDGWGVSLLISEDKMILVRNILSERIKML